MYPVLLASRLRILYGNLLRPIALTGIVKGFSKPAQIKTAWWIAGLAFMLMPLIYSNYLGKKLSALELKKIQLFEKTLAEITNTSNLDAGEDVTYEMDMLQSIIEDLQLVVINKHEEVIDLYNFPEKTDAVKVLADLKQSGPEPFDSEDYLIYYRYPFTLTLLSYFPLVQLLLLLLYAAVGYGLFNASRREEQNRVWVGMAKETAHQLGTPISGLVGWLEALRSSPRDPETGAVLEEMGRDLDKLQRVADRFSKIGSVPELQAMPVIPLLEESIRYISARASRNITIRLEASAEKPNALLNANLFSWVIENLLRNALDAMEQEGNIIIRLFEDGRWLHIEVSDDGRGMSVAIRKQVFKPGFTTKKRGWGLGLSLSRRIVENYHRGKLFVKSTEPGKGTTLAIQLPRFDGVMT